MKIRPSQLFFVLFQPKLSVHFEILFSLMFFKEAIVVLSFMYCFWRNTPTYLRNNQIIYCHLSTYAVILKIYICLMKKFNFLKAKIKDCVF